MILRRLTVSDEPVISDPDARAALRIRHTAEAEVLGAKVAAAVEIIERRTGRTLRPTTLELLLDAPPCFDPFAEEDGAIELKAHPIREVTSVEYRNEAGAWIEVPGDKYEWRPLQVGGEVYFFSSWSWPTLSSEHRDRVRVRFDAGYDITVETGSGDDPELLLPARVRELVLLLAGHLYENREATTNTETYVLPLGLDMIRQELRIFR